MLFRLLSLHSDNRDDTNETSQAAVSILRLDGQGARTLWGGRGGLGLSLLVKESSAGGLSKSWSQRLRIAGKPFNLGLGSYPLITLVKARKRALDNARLVAGGGDPRIPAPTIPTFAEAVDKRGGRQGGCHALRGMEARDD